MEVVRCCLQSCLHTHGGHIHGAATRRRRLNARFGLSPLRRYLPSFGTRPFNHRPSVRIAPSCALSRGQTR